MPEYLIRTASGPSTWPAIPKGTTGHDTDALVSQVAQQVQDFTGERTEWIRYD